MIQDTLSRNRIQNSCVADNVVEPGDINNMDVGVGIFASSCLMLWDCVTSGLGGRYIYFRYNATSGYIVDNTIEQLDLENIGIVVRILSVGVLQQEITFGYFTPPTAISIMSM